MLRCRYRPLSLQRTVRCINCVRFFKAVHEYSGSRAVDNRKLTIYPNRRPSYAILPPPFAIHILSSLKTFTLTPPPPHPSISTMLIQGSLDRPPTTASTSTAFVTSSTAPSETHTPEFLSGRLKTLSPPALQPLHRAPFSPSSSAAIDMIFDAHCETDVGRSIGSSETMVSTGSQRRLSISGLTRIYLRGGGRSAGLAVWVQRNGLLLLLLWWLMLLSPCMSLWMVGRNVTGVQRSRAGDYIGRGSRRRRQRGKSLCLCLLLRLIT
jgi:hypothetical protein